MLALTAQMAALTRQISELTTKMASSSREKAMATNMEFTEEEENSEQCQYMGNHNFNYRSSQHNIFRPNNNLPPYYHLGLRNHKNFSYGNQRNAIITPGPCQPMGERKPSLEENLNFSSLKCEANSSNKMGVLITWRRIVLISMLSLSLWRYK